MMEADFRLVTVDLDEIQVNYPSMIYLMKDLQLMGENNASLNRHHYLSKATLSAASAIYKQLYGKEDSIPATFQIIHLIGWKRSETQPEPKRPGDYKLKLGTLDYK